jgi:hypothetical protein
VSPHFHLIEGLRKRPFFLDNSSSNGLVFEAMELDKPVSVTETPQFISATRKLLDTEDREALIDFLAYHPDAGDVIAGTGGVRKLRWSLPGRGKSGGARIVYYYHDDRIPLFLLNAYAKNEQANISHAERNAFRQVVAEIAAMLKEQNP